MAKKIHKQEDMVTEDTPSYVLQDNKKQDEAIKHGEGPLLIVAGAGTGKTRVITDRIAYLINSKTAKPGEILALTFSEKAAKEMERRVDPLVPYGFIETHISTFHSFGHSIVEENFAELKIAPDWKILRKADSIIFIVENLEKFDLNIYRPLNNPAGYVSLLTDFISKLKDNLITPQEYVAYTKRFGETELNDEQKEIFQKHAELSKFYKKYEEIKTEKNFLDFGDLIMVPYYMLREKKSVLAKYQERFRFILIDEFQDTNYAQFELTKLIADKYKNITVVGDDDQMIYKFRGAAISNIKGFKDHYKDAKVIVLKDNYRSVQSILDNAYKLIKNNTDRLETKLDIEKKLESKYRPTHHFSKHIEIKIFNDYTDESNFIAGEIEGFIKKGMYSFRDIAILARANNDAAVVIKDLEKKGIPFRFTGDEGLFSKREIQFLINFCKTLASPYEFNPICDVAVSEFYSIDPYTMSKFLNRAKDYCITVFDMMKKADIYPELELDDGEKEKVRNLIKDIEFYIERIKEGWRAGEILYDYLKNKNVFQELLKQNTVEAGLKIGNISKFFEILKQFSVMEDYDTIYNFVNYIDLRQKAGDNPREDVLEDVLEDSVQIATVHKAKGLEFKVVFVLGLVQDKFPSKNRGDFQLPLPEELMKDMVDEQQYRQEEERRLFYVAMTRAQDLLYLTAALKYEGKSERKISIFLRELGVEKHDEYLAAVDKQDRLKYFEREKTAFEQTPVIHKDSLIVKLSNYQIDDYLTCPYKYKIIHIFRMPIREQPNIIYGLAMHKVVAEFFKARQENRQVSLAELENIFKSLWKPVGFITREHEQRRFEAGLASVKRFFDEESKNNIVPEFIEKDFEFKLDSWILVRGRWDRIDNINGKTTIIDYKTSEVKDMEKARKKLNSEDISKQLTLYALAYQKAFGRAPDEVAVYFLESSIIAGKKLKQDTINNFEDKIKEVADKIRKQEFGATPSVFECSQCAFATMCQFSKADVLF